MSTPLTAVSGIGPSTEKELKAHGIDSVEALAVASIDQIMQVPGFGEFRALRMKDAAAALLAAPPTRSESPEAECDTSPDSEPITGWTLPTDSAERVETADKTEGDKDKKGDKPKKDKDRKKEKKKEKDKAKEKKEKKAKKNKKAQKEKKSKKGKK